MKRVLIVDDNPADRELMSAACTQAGAQCVVAESVLHARSILGAADAAAGRFAAVFLDLVMPGGPGLEVLRDLRRAASSVPVVVISSSDRQADVYAAYRGGANAYVVKDPAREAFATDVGATVLFWLKLNRVPPVDDDLAADQLRGRRQPG